MVESGLSRRWSANALTIGFDLEKTLNWFIKNAILHLEIIN